MQKQIDLTRLNKNYFNYFNIFILNKYKIKLNQCEKQNTRKN